MFVIQLHSADMARGRAEAETYRDSESEPHLHSAMTSAQPHRRKRRQVSFETIPNTEWSVSKAKAQASDARNSSIALTPNNKCQGEGAVLLASFQPQTGDEDFALNVFDEEPSGNIASVNPGFGLTHSKFVNLMGLDGDSQAAGKYDQLHNLMLKSAEEREKRIGQGLLVGSHDYDLPSASRAQLEAVLSEAKFPIAASFIHLAPVQEGHKLTRTLGAVLIDVLKPDRRPHNSQQNVAMVYVVGPSGQQGVEEFESFLRVLAENILVTVSMYNLMPEVNSQYGGEIQVVQMCIVSDVLPPEVSRERAAEILIDGFFDGALLLYDRPAFYKVMPEVNFAYDHNAFLKAMKKRVGTGNFEFGRVYPIDAGTDLPKAFNTELPHAFYFSFQPTAPTVFDESPTLNTASVNPGFFDLRMHGTGRKKIGYINTEFLKFIDKASWGDYHQCHQLLWDDATCDMGLGPRASGHLVSNKDNGLHAPFWFDNEKSPMASFLRVEPEMYKKKSPLGAVFIDVFKPSSRPHNSQHNVAMVYVVGPSKEHQTLEDFQGALRELARNILVAVSMYNHRADNPSDYKEFTMGHEKSDKWYDMSSSKIDVVQMCLVSGGGRKPKTLSKEDVAESLISGFFAGALDDEFDYRLWMPEVNFAYDDDAFRSAMQKRYPQEALEYNKRYDSSRLRAS